MIGAASHWSKRRNTAAETALPANVQVVGVRLRGACASCTPVRAIVVVPLDDIDFQAGVTTILEAMAMAKPVIVTHSLGQTDVVEDRRTATRGAQPRVAPAEPGADAGRDGRAWRSSRQASTFRPKIRPRCGGRSSTCWSIPRSGGGSGQPGGGPSSACSRSINSPSGCGQLVDAAAGQRRACDPLPDAGRRRRSIDSRPC